MLFHALEWFCIILSTPERLCSLWFHSIEQFHSFSVSRCIDEKSKLFYKIHLQEQKILVWGYYYQWVRPKNDEKGESITLTKGQGSKKKTKNSKKTSFEVRTNLSKASNRRGLKSPKLAAPRVPKLPPFYSMLIYP